MQCKTNLPDILNLEQTPLYSDMVKIETAVRGAGAITRCCHRHNLKPITTTGTEVNIIFLFVPDPRTSNEEVVLYTLEILRMIKLLTR